MSKYEEPSIHFSVCGNKLILMQLLLLYRLKVLGCVHWGGKLRT